LNIFILFYYFLLFLDNDLGFDFWIFNYNFWFIYNFLILKVSCGLFVWNKICWLVNIIIGIGFFKESSFLSLYIYACCIHLNPFFLFVLLFFHIVWIWEDMENIWLVLFQEGRNIQFFFRFGRLYWKFIVLYGNFLFFWKFINQGKFSLCFVLVFLNKRILLLCSIHLINDLFNFLTCELDGLIFVLEILFPNFWTGFKSLLEHFQLLFLPLALLALYHFLNFWLVKNALHCSRLLDLQLNIVVSVSLSANREYFSVWIGDILSHINRILSLSNWVPFLLRPEVKALKASFGLYEPELLELVVFPLLDFFFWVCHMPERLPCVLLVAVSYPFDKVVRLSINDLFIKNLLNLEFRAEGLVKHEDKIRNLYSRIIGQYNERS